MKEHLNNGELSCQIQDFMAWAGSLSKKESRDFVERIQTGKPLDDPQYQETLNQLASWPSKDVEALQDFLEKRLEELNDPRKLWYGSFT